MRPRPVQRLREYARNLFLPPDPDEHSEAWAWAKEIPLTPRNAHLLALLLLALPIASYWIHLFLFAANAPFLDDYEVILGSTNQFLDTHGLWGKLAVLWAQHNEHRLVLPRLVALLEYGLLRHINFRHLCFFGNLVWTATFVLIVREHRKSARKLPLLFYVPLSYLWFSLIHRENMFWAMASLQNYGAVFWSVVALLCQRRGRTVTTCLVCAAGVLTSMMCWPLFVLCIGIALARRAWHQAAALVGTVILLALLYFHHYSTISGHPLFSVAVLDCEATLAYGLAVMGSLLRFAGYSITLGLASVAAILYLVFLRKTSSWSITLAVLALSQAAATAIGRGGYGGDRYEAAVVASRFTTVSVGAAIAIYLLLLDSTKDPRHAIRRLLLCSVLAITHCFAMTAKADIFADLACERDIRASTMAGYIPHTRTPLVCNESLEACEPMLLRSRKLGVFDYTTATGSKRKPKLHVGPLGPSLEMTSAVDFFDGSRIQGWALIPGRFSTTTRIYVVLAKDAQHSYWLPTMKMRRPEGSISQKVQFDYDMGGFMAFPALFNIPPSTYQVGIAVTSSDGLALKWAGLRYRPPFQ